jgi:hypothetical protein
LADVVRLEIGDTAGWKPALQRLAGVFVELKREMSALNGLWLALLLLVALAGNSFAAPELDTAVDARQFFVGDGFVWTLTVSGAKQVEAPETPATPDFFSHALEPQILEQGTNQTFIYRYRLIPRRAGLLPLPPVTVTADGQELNPPPQVLTVGEPQTTNALRLEVSLDHPQVYAGQPLVLTFKLLSALPLASLKALDIQLPLLYQPDFDVIVPLAERRAGGQPGTIGLPVEGQRVIGTLSQLKINDTTFAVITFRRILVPHRAGTFSFAPARLLGSYLPPAANGRNASPQYPSYFDNDFFADTDAEDKFVRYGAQSEPLTLRVQPLPETNRPPNFSGIVGHGQMTDTVQPQTLTIGDPVTLTVRLQGFAYPEAVALPPVARLADFAGQFLVPADQSPSHVESNEVVCVQSLRPLRTAVTQVPALQVVVFNPDTAQYETLATPPIPLRIRPDGDLTAIQLGADASASRSVNPSGIWNNLPPDAVDPLTRAGRWTKLSLPAWLLLPPVVFFALAGAARRHRLKQSDPARWRKLTAFAELRRALRRAGNSEAQRAAVATYLATRLDIREAALSEREVLRALQRQRIEADAETRACLRELFHDADRARFGGGKNAAVTPPEPRRLLATLEKLERRFDQ